MPQHVQQQRSSHGRIATRRLRRGAAVRASAQNDRTKRAAAPPMSELVTAEDEETRMWRERAEDSERKLEQMTLQMQRLQQSVDATSETRPNVNAPPPQSRQVSDTTNEDGSDVSPSGNSKRLLYTQGLTLEPALKEFWYPVDYSSRLDGGTLIPLELFDIPWVIWRNNEGEVCAVKDSCAHRACPLSLGKVSETGCVQCPYHGWEYDKSGTVKKMPSTPFAKNVKVENLVVREADGLIWAWPGEPSRAESTPIPSLLPEGSNFEQHAQIQLDVPVEHGLLMENLLDLSHAPFTHTSTFAKGWPIPDSVKFHLDSGMGIVSGAWDPYPIDMQFVEPCFVISTIGLAAPGDIRRGVKAEDCDKHLRQVHACVPASEGKTRLLYLMHLDFWPWMKNLPLMEELWLSQANQVLGEDLRLVLGQQERMLKSQGDVWGAPVAYDKVGVRYRRWRNQLASCDETKCEVETTELD
ncbi:chlorophyllide a oxygenase [Pseudoscourfieldia marina]